MSNWYPTLEYVRDLVQQKLAIEKIDGNLSTFKYARKVHFDNLWDKVPFMKEIRGIVYDNRTGELVQAPPQKSFNYLENGHWKDLPLDTPVIAYKKYNGFMACATMHNDEIVVSTTGTTNSDYAKWAREEILKAGSENYLVDFYTTLYEITLPQDPHIILEDFGAIVLGHRHKALGIFTPAGTQVFGTLGSLLKLVGEVKHEGFMVYTADGRCCKLKSPYYLGKKKLMRMTDKVIDAMYQDSSAVKVNLHSMWHPVVDRIVSSYPQGVWSAVYDQSRREVIEVYEREYW